MSALNSDAANERVRRVSEAAGRAIDKLDAASTLDSAFARLRKWSRDEEHIVQSVRHWEPTYKSPAALRADVRVVLDELVKARVTP